MRGWKGQSVVVVTLAVVLGVLFKRVYPLVNISTELAALCLLAAMVIWGVLKLLWRQTPWSVPTQGARGEQHDE